MEHFRTTGNDVFYYVNKSIQFNLAILDVEMHAVFTTLHDQYWPSVTQKEP